MTRNEFIRIFLNLTVLSLMFFTFYKALVRWILKRFSNKQEIKKLQGLTAINREYSSFADLREYILDTVLRRTPPNPDTLIDEFRNTITNANYSQFIEDKRYKLRRELREMGVPNWKIKIFL